MNIQRHQQEKEFFKQFEDDTLNMNCLAPGVAKTSDDLLFNGNYTSLMCSTQMKKKIEDHFGPSQYSVDGKEKKASFFAFSFQEQVIICISERGIGTKWYWVNSPEKGSRYGTPMLLSCDTEVKNFWPDFCSDFKEIIEYKDTSKLKMR